MPRMTQAESRRRRTALVKALEMGHLGQPTLSEAARYAGVRHGNVQLWIKNYPDVATAWARAQGGFRLGDRPELPDFVTFRKRYFDHDTPKHQREWLEHIQAHPITAMWMPPGAGKTSFLLELITYRLIENRDARFLIVCSNEVEARKRVDWLETALSDHAMYEPIGRPSLVADFGPFAPKPGERSRLAWTRGFFTVTGRSEPAKDYSVQAIGLRGKMYGSRLDFVLLDDIVEDYQPETEQERIISWLLGRVQSRLPADGKVAPLATRADDAAVGGRPRTPCIQRT